MDVAHVFKFESLHDVDERFCVDESDHFVFREGVGDEEWEGMMMSLGVERARLERRDFSEWLGLPTEVAELERMDVLYVYDAMDYDVYSKLVAYYWQDFVCFDYAADYRSDVLQPLMLYQGCCEHLDCLFDALDTLQNSREPCSAAVSLSVFSDCLFELSGVSTTIPGAPRTLWRRFQGNG